MREFFFQPIHMHPRTRVKKKPSQTLFNPNTAEMIVEVHPGQEDGCRPSSQVAKHFPANDVHQRHCQRTAKNRQQPQCLGGLTEYPYGE